MTNQDKFAMQFGNWLFANKDNLKLYCPVSGRGLIRKPMNELLMMFKEEKGL